MKNTWIENNFELITTEDGSPSLVMTFEKTAECMHHRGGAWAETQLIYAEPAKQVMQLGGRRFLSIGLGLGYNELMIFSLASQLQIELELVTSFEKDLFLQKCFQNYIQGLNLPLEIQSTYTKLSQLIGDSKENIEQARKEGKFILREALSPQSLPTEKYDCVLFDVFSSKSTPELWSEEFLVQFLENLGEDCVFTTYACTGALKRALKKTEFQFIPRPGFQRRKDSALAVRGRKYQSITSLSGSD